MQSKCRSAAAALPAAVSAEWFALMLRGHDRSQLTHCRYRQHTCHPLCWPRCTHPAIPYTARRTALVHIPKCCWIPPRNALQQRSLAAQPPRLSLKFGKCLLCWGAAPPPRGARNAFRSEEACLGSNTAARSASCTPGGKQRSGFVRAGALALRRPRGGPAAGAGASRDMTGGARRGRGRGRARRAARGAGGGHERRGERERERCPCRLYVWRGRGARRRGWLTGGRRAPAPPPHAGGRGYARRRRPPAGVRRRRCKQRRHVLRGGPLPRGGGRRARAAAATGGPKHGRMCRPAAAARGRGRRRGAGARGPAAQLDISLVRCLGAPGRSAPNG